MRIFFSLFFVVAGIADIGVRKELAAALLGAFLVLAYADWVGQGSPRSLRPFRSSPTHLDPGPERRR